MENFTSWLTNQTRFLNQKESGSLQGIVLVLPLLLLYLYSQMQIGAFGWMLAQAVPPSVKTSLCSCLCASLLWVNGQQSHPQSCCLLRGWSYTIPSQVLQGFDSCTVHLAQYLPMAASLDFSLYHHCTEIIVLKWGASKTSPALMLGIQKALPVDSEVHL